MMDEETYLWYSYIILAICVLFWLTVLFCCLGPFIIWYTSEDEDGPTTLRESLRKSPYGQRSTASVECTFPSVLRRRKQSKKARERMRLEGNRVTTACRRNTLPNQCPLIAAEFFGIRDQENPIHTIL